MFSSSITGSIITFFPRPVKALVSPAGECYTWLRMKTEANIMKITWLGHSCFMLETAGGNIVFDPYSDGSVPGWQLAQLTADEVLCSHQHADHGGTEKVTLTGKGCSCAVDRIDCFHDDAEGTKRGKNIIHIVSAEGMRVVHMGDIGHELSDEQYARIGTPDVLLIPIGGYYTIDAAMAKHMADKIGARITVPMHYRGEGFGYDVIGTLDEYTSLCDDVTYLDTNSFDPADYTARVTLVPKAVK